MPSPVIREHVEEALQFIEENGFGASVDDDAIIESAAQAYLDATAPGQFTLSIRLGNDAMRTPADIIAALEQVSARLSTGYRQGRIHSTYDEAQPDTGIIRDVNGNTVGTWEVR